MVAAGAATAAAEAATGAAAKVTAAAVYCGSVRGATEVAVVNGARAEFCCRSGAGGTAAAEAATEAAVEAATGAAAKVTAAAVCCGSVRGATEVAVVNGARAEFCCRSGAGGAMKTAGGDEVRSGCVDGDQGSSLMLATCAACLRFMFAISSSMVCRWAVTSWKRVLNSRALPSCISAVRRAAAAAAEESCASCSRRAAVSEQERTSAR